MSDRYEHHENSIHNPECAYPEWQRLASGRLQCTSCGVIVTPEPPAKVEAE